MMRAAVLGSPVAHSLSPALHSAAYAELGLGDWSYEALECDEARLQGLLEPLGTDWAGLSLTMPLKRAVIGLLDWVSPLASQVGAVNTVVFGAPAPGGETAGRPVLRGYNTDVGGMVDALAAAGGEADGGPARPATADPAGALILGGGATACSALAALRDIGLRKATVAVRAAGRAGELLAAADRLGISVQLTGVDFGRGAGGGGWDLVISTIPSGAADELAADLQRLAPAVVLDVVYDPWPTKLAATAQEAGAVVIGGFELLLYQAARQVQLMTGLEPPVEAMRSAGLAALVRRRPDRVLSGRGTIPATGPGWYCYWLTNPVRRYRDTSGGPPPTLPVRAGQA
jgi:shikimate dehydrogenase